MISIIAKWTILEGKRQQALSALRILADEVLEKEPFVLMYTIHTPDFSATSFPTPPVNEVVFFSVFTDQEAFQKHLHGPVFKDWSREYKHLFLCNDGNLFVISEFLERQAGYVRQQMVTVDE